MEIKINYEKRQKADSVVSTSYENETKATLFILLDSHEVMLV